MIIEKYKLNIMKNKYYYITTPIYYVNDIPHIGHLYTTLACDVLARFMRLIGKEVKFVTGTDEHGQKVEKAALLAEMSAQDFTDKVSEHFRDLTKSMNCSHDDFIRTTEKRHIKAVEHLWNKLVDAGYIYLGKYSGWYSVRDEAFYSESEIKDGFAPTGAPVEWVEEPSYFFALSKFGDKLLEYYHTNPEFIKPESRRNEVISFVKSGLTDLSISRTSFKWGVPVPGDESHVIYVWLDALTNYISALGYPNEGGEFKKFWPASVHVVGKDIIRFHAIYWPAFLMAADLPVPTSIMSHGWWMNDGNKMSKSLGNVINPFELIEEFGVDSVRYFLMREIIFGNDGNFSKKNLIQKINTELSNKIGNLAQRSLSFVFKNCGGIIPKSLNAYDSDLLKHCLSLRDKIITHAENQEISQIIDEIIKLADKANIFIDHMSPWNLKKTDSDRMMEVLYIILESIRYIGILMQPFVPESADKLLSQLGVKKEMRNFSFLDKSGALIEGTKIEAPTPIFPRFVEI